MKRFLCLVLALMWVVGASALCEISAYDRLRGLGIEVPEESECIVQAWMDQINEEYRQYLGEGVVISADEELVTIMSLLGTGEYIRETDSFRTLTDGLYAFDMEMTWIEEGYERLLDAVERMSGGTIDIEDISIEIDEAILDEGEGEFPLRFTMNGDPCEYTLELDTDWMDIRVLDYLNRDIGKYDDRRRLWSMFDEGQGLIVFYRDGAWAKRFRQETGFRLMDNVDEEEGAGGVADFLGKLVFGLLFH